MSDNSQYAKALYVANELYLQTSPENGSSEKLLSKDCFLFRIVPFIGMELSIKDKNR